MQLKRCLNPDQRKTNLRENYRSVSVVTNFTRTTQSRAEGNGKLVYGIGNSYIDLPLSKCTCGLATCLSLVSPIHTRTH